MNPLIAKRVAHLPGPMYFDMHSDNLKMLDHYRDTKGHYINIVPIPNYSNMRGTAIDMTGRWIRVKP